MNENQHSQRKTGALRRLVLSVVFVVCGPGTVYAQTCPTPLTVEPPNPTSSAPVYLHFVGPGTDDDCQVTTVEVAGTEVRVETNFACAITSFTSDRRQLIGVLPAGNYTVIVRDGHADCDMRASFVVAAVPAVPALSRTLELVLLISLCAIALLATRATGPGV